MFIRRFSTKLNRFSSELTQNESRGAALAMLRATGLKKEDMNKPQIGISTMWYEGNPCNMHLNQLAASVKKSVKNHQMIGYIFNTIGVSDGMAMGTSGMRYSLPSRELIADSIETVMNAQHYDANISIPGCDKNMPGALMAMARVNRPSILVYGGSILPGCHKEKNIDIVDAFQSYGRLLTGEIDILEREQIISKACNGAGSCGGMYTANTMACVSEALGMTLPNSSSNPANSQDKIKELEASGYFIKNCLYENIKPLDIMTKPAFENAITLTMALGGSTNAVLHLLAIAHTAGVDLKLEDFQMISDKTPYIGNLKPSGEHHMVDLHKIGGTSVVIKYLIKEGLMKGDVPTITGRSLWENVMHCNDVNFESNVIKSVRDPIKPNGHIQILYGNLAPEGSVAKITDDKKYFKGVAKVYESEQEMLTSLKNGDIQKGIKTVIIIRNEGPKHGMPEMLAPTSTLVGMGLDKDCALITDGRFSGGSHGFIIGHVSPESFQFPYETPLEFPRKVANRLSHEENIQDDKMYSIAFVENGDIIEIDIKKGKINNLTYNFDDMHYLYYCPGGRNWDQLGGSYYKLKKGMKYRTKSINLKQSTGYLRKYQKLVSSASTGCITDN